MEATNQSSISIISSLESNKRLFSLVEASNVSNKRSSCSDLESFQVSQTFKAQNLNGRVVSQIEFPHEIWVEIFKNCSRTDLFKVRLSSKELKTIAEYTIKKHLTIDFINVSCYIINQLINSFSEDTLGNIELLLNLSGKVVLDKNKDNTCQDISVSKVSNYHVSLYHVTRYQTAQAIALLIRAGGNIHVKNCIEGPGTCINQTILMYVILSGVEADITTKIVSLLLEAGADINERDNRGRTALMCAAGTSHVRNVKLLIEQGADVNLQCHRCDTALITAVEVGEIEIVNILIQAGANVNAQNEDGMTPLLMSAMKGYVQIAQLLLSNNADITTLIN